MSAWLLAVVLVAVPSAAGAAAAVAAGVLVVAVLVAVRSPRGPITTIVALGAVAAGLCGLVSVAVLVGEDRRVPAVVRQAAGRTVPVELVLERDLAAGDRSVLATLVAVGDVGDLHVPVRAVPGRSSRPTVLAAGTGLRSPGSVEPDAAGAPTAAVVFLRGTPEQRPPDGLLGGLLGATATVRRAFVQVTRPLPEPGGALLRGLAIGDRSGLDPGTEAAMETAALTHLTAVSGSNCAVVVALVVVVGGVLGLPRWARAAVAVALLLGFVVLVRPDPSIVRATGMAVLALLVRLSGRPVRGLPLVALAVIAMLLVDPWYARSTAFVLSVLATSGIVVLAPPLTAVLARRLWPSVAAAVAVPVAAQAACWPATVPLAAALPTYAVPANLLTEPLAPVVTVVGLASCLLAPLWPWGSAVLAAVAWAPASAIAAVAHGAAALPAASLPWPAGAAGVLAAVVVSGCVAAALLTSGATRLRLVLAAGVVVVVGVVAVALPRAVVRGGVPSDWSVAACDVGQGDAVLVRDGTADGGTALVDTGDDGERLQRCLDLLGVGHVDLLVLTHFDRDHVGAVDTVAERVTTALVGPVGRPADAAVVRSLRRAGVDVRSGDDGTAGVLGALRWRLLWPRAGSRDAGNGASLVLRTAGGPDCGRCVSGVFLGDLGEDAQRRLLRTGSAGGPVEVVKVAHHGSADQDPELYREVAAPVGLIGVGSDNTYGHPTPSALRMLAAAGTRVFRTDLHGTVVVARAADGALRVWTERPGSAVARRIDPWPPRSPLARQRRSTRCRGRASGRHRSCSSPGRSPSSPTAPAACSATCSSARTRRSRCTTSKRTSTLPGCSPPWPARRCSANRDSSG